MELAIAEGYADAADTLVAERMEDLLGRLRIEQQRRRRAEAKVVSLEKDKQVS